jgi:hypothetical protein
LLEGKQMMLRPIAPLGAMLLLFAITGAVAQDQDELAQKLSNPVSSLISVPFQYNMDYGAGPNGDGTNLTLKIQPVIPFELNEDWNVITRIILPITSTHDVYPGDPYGLGDTALSLFFTPRQPNEAGIVWAIGPAFSIPTATDPFLGTGNWGVGPTGLILIQRDELSVGLLATQTWGVASYHDRRHISVLALQPFVNYSLGSGQTLSANLETTYDWHSGQWTVPLNVGYSKVFQLGEQPMSFQIGFRKYLAAPPNGPDWGVRSTLTFLFPE